MSIKRYIATKDTTITNAFKANLKTRGTGSNMGDSDVSEVFSIYAQASTSSLEKSRVLTQWDTTSIQTDRDAGDIPSSGSVNFYLKLHNAKHSFTVPRNITLVVAAVSRSWDEGTGLDMDEYTDAGYANWVVASSASSGLTNWTTQGGDFHLGAYSPGTTLPFYSQTLPLGIEDLEVNITALVEEWLAGTSDEARENYGVGVYLTSSQENTEDKNSYYTKKFFARRSEFFYKRPTLEARWDSARKDDAGNFYLSSSLAPAADNLNTLYFYNNVRGQLRNIPSIDTGEILLSMYSTLGDEAITLPVGGGVATNNDINVTGGWDATGVYSASFAYTGSATTIYPVWHSAGTEYHTGSSVSVKSPFGSDHNPSPEYVTNITNLKSEYNTSEMARLRLYTRQKDWCPTIYTKATSVIQTDIVESGFYKVVRVVDDFEVIPYGTGSSNHTQMSFDASGSYFDLDMSLFEGGYQYGIKFVYNVNGANHEQPEVFKFRVE